MSKQVLSIEQMQHLEELGVDTSKANFYWHRTKSLNNYNDWDEWKLHYGVLRLARGFTTINCQYVRTFTLQDILDLLTATVDDDYRLYIDKGLVLWTVGYVDAVSEEIYEDFRERDLIDAAYEMLCWCIVNGYVETKK
jgi:hypothetical protein